MKSIANKLLKIKEHTQDIVEGREITFDERTDKWQDSERGEMHQQKTDELQGVVDNLEMTIDSLEVFNN